MGVGELELVVTLRVARGQNSGHVRRVNGGRDAVSSRGLGQLEGDADVAALEVCVGDLDELNVEEERLVVTASAPRRNARTSR